MNLRMRWIAFGMIATGALLSMSSAIVSRESTVLCRTLALTGGLLALTGGCLLAPRRSVLIAENLLAEQQIAISREELRTQQEQFDELRSEAAKAFLAQSERIRDREHDLAQRLTRFHEFLEFPRGDVEPERTTDEIIRLSDRDREVNRILEAEAERVYEKVRANGYSKDGKPDFVMMREEAGNLIRRVAKVYSPESENPLLETSFEQLARAAGRICLHVLVLLEQLPINVQQYNFSSLYSYFRKAAVGYGAYQKAAPWLTYLTRGVYVGRMVTATNPVTLGAWWLATEVGKRGAQKFVENVVDRQAIAILHDLITVLGVEVASVFGTGFRHRDPSWVLGTEIVELVSSFPISRESLSEGLKLITQLPLRNEYDRIYLYRCLASHQTASNQIRDPAALSREEREAIAGKVEQFLHAHIHGATQTQTEKWRTGFERRFDLKLRINAGPVKSSRTDQIFESLNALNAFVSLAEVATDELRRKVIQGSQLIQLLPSDHRQRAEQLAEPRSERFEPPGIDPSSDITDALLADLVRADILLPDEDGHLEQLVTEIGAYFRRSAADMKIITDRYWLANFRELSGNENPHSEISGESARRILTATKYPAQIVFAYPFAALKSGDRIVPLPTAWLVGYRRSSESQLETVLLNGNTLEEQLWIHHGELKVCRIRGIVVDDLLVSGGEWNHAIQLSGSLKGGRFRTYFAAILAQSKLTADTK
ncbi:MAG: hypothetical protein JNL58_00105 [Planctomyces sp.]|nr:hypothetical protein [Planctomyces sp.]